MNASELFTTRIGMRYPIIQAPMAGVSTPRLAAAVSNAGGLGSLGLGASPVEAARRMVEETRALTDGPFQVNLFCHEAAKRDGAAEAAWLSHLAPLFERFGGKPPTELREIYPSFLGNEAMLEMLLEQRPAVVSFHFGLPSREFIAALRGRGIYTFATATNEAEAEKIEQAGVDAVVAQGIEAGGHRGVFDPEASDEAWGTAELVRRLTARNGLPVVAAGGIMNGGEIRAALRAGAVAAQLGTAFILCPESAANEGYRARLRGAKAGATALTSVISGRPARGVVNELMRYGSTTGSPPPPAYPVAYDAAKQLNEMASRAGSDEYAAHWAGQGVPLARELPASELMKVLISELEG